MNLQQLETFRLVAELGSFTRAARTLNSTQSTVSMRVAQLERELDVQLLDRSKRAVNETTKSGKWMECFADRGIQVAEQGLSTHVRHDGGGSRAKRH